MHPRSLGNGTLTPRIPREIAAVIDALQLTGADTEALRELTDSEWESLLTFADLAHLTLSLAQVEKDGFPAWVVERLNKNVADNAARFERVKTTYMEVAAALEKAQVEYVVLKGFTQSPYYVKDPHFRTQSDLDLYIPQPMIESAQQALQAIGYQSEKTLDYSRADHVPSMIRPGNWQWRGNPFDPEMPLSVELHFCLWNERVALFPVPEVDCFWERRTTRAAGDITFPALKAMDHLGHLALHILRNILAGEWVLNHVYELATFLQTYSRDDVFWKSWKQTHSDSLRELETIAFFHARTWFCCDVHDEVEKEIAGLPPGLEKWLQHFVGSSLEGMFRKNKDSVWLQMTLLKSPKGRRRVLQQVFLPTRVSRMNSPAIGLKNRRSNKWRISDPYGQYICYLVTRSATHVRMGSETLLRGFRWWLSQRQLEKQFWIFLATSFFLTWGCLPTSFYSICC